MKAQAWTMDFAASVVIFMVVLVLAMFALNYAIYQNQQQASFNQMENAAMSASDSLIRQPGIPSSWNRTSVTTIGLASQENVLNETKLAEFMAMDYGSIKGLLGIANDQFYFEVRYPNGSLASLPSGGLLSKGSYPSEAGMVIPVDRYVIYLEKPATMTLIVWN